MKNSVFILKVCPPGLHISLGIFQRLFDLLEAEAHHLDRAYAQQCQSQVEGETSFATYTNTTRQIKSLEDERTALQQHITWLEQTATLMSLTAADSADGPLHITREEVVKNRKKLQEIVR